jgi:hypothetical protein
MILIALIILITVLVTSVSVWFLGFLIGIPVGLVSSFFLMAAFLFLSFAWSSRGGRNPWR